MLYMYFFVYTCVDYDEDGLEEDNDFAFEESLLDAEVPKDDSEETTENVPSIPQSASDAPPEKRQRKNILIWIWIWM